MPWLNDRLIRKQTTNNGWEKRKPDVFLSYINKIFVKKVPATLLQNKNEHTGKTNRISSYQKEWEREKKEKAINLTVHIYQFLLCKWMVGVKDFSRVCGKWKVYNIIIVITSYCTNYLISIVSCSILMNIATKLNCSIDLLCLHVESLLIFCDHKNLCLHCMSCQIIITFLLTHLIFAGSLHCCKRAKILSVRECLRVV